MNTLSTNMTSYLHFQCKPLMNLEIFTTVHSLMNNINLIDSCRAMSFEHRIHSPEVRLVLRLTVSHTRVARAEQASCSLHWLSAFTLAVPLFRFHSQTKQLIQ